MLDPAYSGAGVVTDARFSAIGERISPPDEARIGLPELELSVADRTVFFESILNPPAPNEHLKEATARYWARRREREKA